jgi:hypothetical protein
MVVEYPFKPGADRKPPEQCEHCGCKNITIAKGWSGEYFFYCKECKKLVGGYFAPEELE